MKKIKLTFISLLFVSCSILPEQYDIYKHSDYKSAQSTLSVDSPKTILTLMFGQSNAGTLAPSKFNNFYARNVKGFDWDYKVFVDSFSANEIRTHVFSPLILIADSMRQLNAVDDLYFAQFQQGGTTLDVQWNIYNTLSTSLFKKMCLTIDQALSQMPSPDNINLFWVHGEEDSKYQTMANNYFQNEINLYDSLVSRYGSIQFYTYIPNTNTAYINQVKTAKYNHASSTNKTIAIPVNSSTYQSGMVHMNPNGVRVFVDSVMKKMN